MASVGKNLMKNIKLASSLSLLQNSCYSFLSFGRPQLYNMEAMPFTYRVLVNIYFRDHSYLTSSHFWDFWIPLPPYVSMFLVLRISKNWHFLTPLPPTSADVIYEWSLAYYELHVVKI